MNGVDDTRVSSEVSTSAREHVGFTPEMQKSAAVLLFCSGYISRTRLQQLFTQHPDWRSV
jgi:hypothetical protein